MSTVAERKCDVAKSSLCGKRKRKPCGKKKLRNNPKRSYPSLNNPQRGRNNESWWTRLSDSVEKRAAGRARTIPVSNAERKRKFLSEGKGGSQDFGLLMLAFSGQPVQ